jgi:hypothetical protein
MIFGISSLLHLRIPFHRTSADHHTGPLNLGLVASLLSYRQRGFITQWLPWHVDTPVG